MPNLAPKNKLVNVVSKSAKHCAFPIEIRLSYGQSLNFAGTKTEAYDKKSNHCLVSDKAAYELCHLQKNLNQLGYGLSLRKDKCNPESIWAYPGNGYLEMEVINLKTEKKLFMGTQVIINPEKNFPDSLVFYYISSQHLIAHDWKLLKDRGEFEQIKEQWRVSTGEEWFDENEAEYRRIASHNRKILEPLDMANEEEFFLKEEAEILPVSRL